MLEENWRRETELSFWSLYKTHYKIIMKNQSKSLQPKKKYKTYYILNITQLINKNYVIFWILNDFLICPVLDIYNLL